jgi:HTH-type transcriptional regulator, sugar sensing transcriptional regulator
MGENKNMIVQKEFLGKIRDLGINSYEAKLWTALLSRGMATAGELSDIANVPRSRSYDVLESLERKGFIVMKLGKPIRYIAVPPQEVIERVKSKIQEDAEHRGKMLDQIKESDVLSHLNTIYQSGSESVDPQEMTGVVRGRVNLISHINSLFKNAKESIEIAFSPANADIVADLRKGLNKAQKNNIKIRTIVPQAHAPKHGEHKHAEVGFRFVLIDNTHVVFMPVDSGMSQDFAVWVQNDKFAKNFTTVFNKLWE